MPGGIKSNNYETMIRDEGANVKFFHMDTKTLLIINCAATRGVSRPFCGKGSDGREIGVYKRGGRETGRQR